MKSYRFDKRRLVTCFGQSFAHFDIYYPEWDTATITSAAELQEGDILVLHGGGDIHPSYYNQVNKFSVVGVEPTARDIAENEILDRAIELKLPIFGICRGAQWACIKAGGSLWQDTSGHPSGKHLVTIREEGEPILSIMSNSAHHQQMCVDKIPKTDYEVLGVYPSRSTIKKNEKGVSIGASSEDLEIVWFSKINAFAIQGHPEWLGSTHSLVVYACEKAVELWDIPVEGDEELEQAC